MRKPSAEERPGLQVIASRPAATAEAACKLLMLKYPLFHMGGVLVRIVVGPDGAPEPEKLDEIAVMRLVEDSDCRIYRQTADNEKKDTKFPRDAAAMVLDMAREKFPPLHGFASVPRLTSKDTIRSREGYDPKTGLWFHNLPEIDVPAEPTDEDAFDALALLRHPLRTFCFADATRDAKGWVDQREQPGDDESGALVSIFTAALRPYLDFAPGLLVTAPPLSGSGAGKGLLVRTITAIAYGAPPRILNVGQRATELESRLGAALMKAASALLLDNVNGPVPPTDLLASSMTEPVVEFRELGVSRLVKLYIRLWLAVNGNGTKLQEDTRRRFILSKLDPKVEDAEARAFPSNPVQMVMQDRGKYLSAVLTIWRWGRQRQLPAGTPFGSFEQWAEWCRDPILALTGVDVVERARAEKWGDDQRAELAEVHRLWFKKHGTRQVRLRDLDPDLATRLNPSDRHTPQGLRRALERRLSTNVSGATLVREHRADGDLYRLLLDDAAKARLGLSEHGEQRQPNPAEPQRNGKRFQYNPGPNRSQDIRLRAEGRNRQSRHHGDVE